MSVLCKEPRGAFHHQALRLGCRISRESIGWLAKGINDAKKYRQKLRRLKNSRRERERKIESSFLGCFVLLVLVREMIKRPTSYSIPRSSMCTPDLPATLLRTFARPFLSRRFRVFLTCSSALPFPLLPSLSLFLSIYISLYLAHTYTHRHTHYFSPSPSAFSSFFLPRVFCQEPSRAEASRTALKQKRSDVKCDYESCESSSRTRMLR